MSDKKEQFAKNVLESCLLAALIIAPLFTNAYGALPFEEAKVSLLRSIAVLAFPFFIFVLIKQGNDESKPSSTGSVWHFPLVMPALIVGCAYLVSTVFSVSPASSFFGMYLRRQGMYTILCYLFFFFVVLSTIHTQKQIERLLFAILLAGFTAAVWAIIQPMGLDPDLGANFRGRPWSMLGNPIFLSAFLIMTVPLHFYFLNSSLQTLREYRRRGIHLKSSSMEVMFFGLMIVFFAVNLTAIVLAQSRGPALGLVVGLLFFAVLHALRQGHTKIVAIFFMGGAGLLLLLVPLNLLDEQFAWFFNMPALNHLHSPFQFDTGLVRVYIWKGVVALISSNPLRILTGYGPETLPLTLPMHSSPQLQYIECPTAVADRAHNEMLDLLATQGILGLIAFLLFFGAFCRFVLRQLGLIRSRRQDIVFFGFLLLGALLGWLVPYAASGNFTFSGVGLGIGLIGGLFSYLFFFALIMKGGAFCPWHPNALLLSIILAALVAHFVEIQLCFGITTTRLYFWVFAALAVAVGKSAGEGLGVPADQGRQKYLFSPSIIIPAFLAGLVFATMTFDYICFSKTNKAILYAVFGCYLCIFTACGIFSIEQLRSETDRSSERLSGLAAYLFVASAFGGLYMASYFLMENKCAHLLFPFMRNSIFPVFEKNIKLAAYYGWILAFVFLSSFLTLFRREATEHKRAAFKAVWIFPILALLALPALISFNLKNPMADIYTKAGEELMRVKQWEVARLCFNKAVALEPNQAWRHEKLGYLFFARAKEASEHEKNIFFQEAMSYMGKATKLAPLDVTLKNNLARTSSAWAAYTTDGKIRFHRLKVTEMFYAEALTKDPRNTFLWKESAQIAAALGKINEAVQRFQRVLHLRPNDFETHRNLALLYRSLTRYALALDHAEIALRLGTKKDRSEIEHLVTELKDKNR